MENNPGKKQYRADHAEQHGQQPIANGECASVSIDLRDVDTQQATKQEYQHARQPKKEQWTIFADDAKERAEHLPFTDLWLWAFLDRGFRQHQRGDA